MSNALASAWERTLRRRGADTAVVHAWDGASFTFDELDRRARSWLASHATQALPLAGRAVVFSTPNGIGWFEVFLGLLRAGAVMVPLDPGEPPAAQERIAASVRAAFRWDGSHLLPLDGSRRLRGRACLVKLTSGSTGEPRPLVFTAEQLIADGRQVTATMGIGVNDLNHALIPLGHSYGLGNLTLPLITRGIPLVCGSSPLPSAVAEEIHRWRPTVFPSVPAVWRALAAAGVEPALLKSLRLAVSAGAPLPPEVARDFLARFGLPLCNFYGSSETGGIAFDRGGGATLVGGVGRPLRSVQVTALRGRRIRVCSPAVFTAGNRRRTGGQGCWSPGDLATLDARGGLRLAGRRGAIVKVAGRRVSVAEVELSLRRLAGVREACVQVSPGPEAILGAAVATERPVAELRAELALNTAPWKIPKKWAVVPGLPLNARGKVDARSVAARLFG